MITLLPPLDLAYTKKVKLNLNRSIHPGFGAVILTRDGKTVWEDCRMERQRHGYAAEMVARKDPDHDWRLIVDGPLSGVEYQRHGRNEWYAVATNRGFA